MARKSETRQIGPNTYRATQLKVRKANRVLERLLKTLGPTLGALGDHLGTGKTGTAAAIVGDLERGAISAAAEKLARALTGDELNWLVDELIPSIEYQTPELAASMPGKFVELNGDLWDDIWAGDLLGQFKALGWILELNYGSFFAGAGGIGAVARQFVTPTKSSSSSPTTPTSGSGGSSSSPE